MIFKKKKKKIIIKKYYFEKKDLPKFWELYGHSAERESYLKKYLLWEFVHKTFELEKEKTHEINPRDIMNPIVQEYTFE